MHKIWQRFLASPLGDKRAWWVSAVLVFFLPGCLYVALPESESPGQVSAIVALLGLQIAALNIVVALYGAVRASPAGDDDVSLRTMLAKRVHRQECEARTALLSGVIAVDLVFDERDSPSTSPAGRLHTPALDSGNGKRRRNGTLWRFSVPVMRLLLWKVTSFSLRRGRRPWAFLAGRKGAGSLADVTGYFAKLQDKRLVIVGEKGSGKTMLAIELVIGLARAIIADPTVNGGAVPVRLSAATWTTGRPFAEWLTEQLVETCAVSYREADSLVKGNLVMPVLDGLDEMDAGFDDLSGRRETGRPDVVRSSEDQAPTASRAAELIKALNTYYADATFAPVVVVTRPGCHTRLRERGTRLDHAHCIEIRPLTTRQLTRYLTNRYRDRPDQARAWRPILRRLNSAAYKGVRTFLATPWRLTLATTTIESDPAQTGQLVPGGRHTVFKTRAASDRMARQTHERLERSMLEGLITAAIALTPRRRTFFARTPYTPQQVERWLAELAHHLRWQADMRRQADPRREAPHAEEQAIPRGMSGVDILPHLLWPIAGHLLPRLLHAAITLVLYSAAGILLLSPSGWNKIFDGWRGPLLPGQWTDTVAQALVLALIWGWFLLLSIAVGTRWPTPGIATRRKNPVRSRVIQAGMVLVIWLTLGVLLGIVIDAVFDQGFGLAVGLVFGAVGGLAHGLAGGLPDGLATGFTEPLTARYRLWNPSIDLVLPHRAVHSDLIFGLTVALAGGLAGALAGGIGQVLSAGSTVGAVAGLAAGLTGGLANGFGAGAGGVRYMIGITLAALRGRLPWRFAAFCRWACQAKLLRVAGAGYQFRHRELQDWLLANRRETRTGRNGRRGSRRT